MERPGVLVVDDDDATRLHLSVLVSGLGYEVTLAASGEEALSLLLSNHRPAVIASGECAGRRAVREASRTCARGRWPSAPA